LSIYNTNVAETLLFLHHLARTLVEYFKSLEEESIRDNFVIIYELLDEMMDFGYPQVTDNKMLKECVVSICAFISTSVHSVATADLQRIRYITQDSHKLEIQAAASSATILTQTVSWRAEGIKYRKNEVYLDVIESVNLLVRAPQPRLPTSCIGRL